MKTSSMVYCICTGRPGCLGACAGACVIGHSVSHVIAVAVRLSLSIDRLYCARDRSLAYGVELF
jgi:hypothetical protein